MSDWQTIDRNLRNAARQRMLLDVEEARWLREAVAEDLHLHFGCATMVEYLEQVAGYTPKVAGERLRIALKLEDLPLVEQEMRAGRLVFSAVREVTRVATPQTEQAWVAASVGKTVHEVQAMVSGRRPGDLPSDPARPDLETKIVRHEISTATMALLRQATRVLEDELGQQLNDDELVAAMCRAVLDDRQASAGEGLPTAAAAAAAPSSCTARSPRRSPSDRTPAATAVPPPR